MISVTSVLHTIHLTLTQYGELRLKMRILLFCENRYAIDILLPLYEEAIDQGTHKILWYINTRKFTDISLPESAEWSSNMQDLYDFNPEAIYVPGNIVPYYLPGVKVQVFHGYAAEKKDQFRIRNYFDLYMTQGPYFTSRFRQLQDKYKDFEVVETGWTKQDWIRKHLHDYDSYKGLLLDKYGKKKIVLYAPTFSPRLTSLECMINPLTELLASEKDFLLILKFHPLTNETYKSLYKTWAGQRDDVLYAEASENITKYQLISDVMISDTSSAVYEFTLLDRPVITIRSIAKDIFWENINDEKELVEAYRKALTDTESSQRRHWIKENYDPYFDGFCCKRMIEATENYIARYGTPLKRNLNIWRKYMSIKTFGTIKK